MTHPQTRAARRYVRQVVIRSALSKTSFLHFFNRHCTCWPTGYSRSRQTCNLHEPLDGRKVSGFGKTGPRNWINDMEPEWQYSGIIRRDFRAGGGRRRDEWGCKRGRYAGRFNLQLTEATEWAEDLASAA